MSLAVEILVALAGGVVALVLVTARPRAALAVAVLAAGATMAVAVLAAPDAALVIDRMGLQGSEPARRLAIGWSAGLVLLALLGLTEGSAIPGAIIAGSGLIALAGARLALAVDDGTVAFAALAAGGIVAIVMPSLAGWAAGRDDAPRVGVAGRALAAVGGAGLIAMATVAWSQSPAGPLGMGTIPGVADAGARAAVGLAMVTMVAAVVLRAGAIPLHLWAARLVGVLSPLAVPAVLAWGSAAFTIVAAGWGATAATTPLDDLDRLIIAVVALASIVFGGLASMLHDDLEHVLGYLVVQDAGVALLAFVALSPEAVDAVAAWVIATAALRTGLAGWISAVRWTFGSHRLPELRGWARRSPVLGMAFAGVLAGSVGLPGVALFEARVRLAAALPAPVSTLVIVVALSPLLALGRLLVAGVGRPSPAVAGAPEERVGRTLGSVAAWSRGGVRSWLRAGAEVVRANEGLGVAVATLVLAAIGLALAILGAGSPAA